MDIQIIVILLIAGSVAGFTAGLLGIGGGLVVIPITLAVAHWLKFPLEHLQHIAVGTSFGVMIFTTFVSMMTQHKRKAINWHIAKLMILGSVIGTLLGSFVATYIPGKELQIIFVVFCYVIAIKTFINRKIEQEGNVPSKKTLSGYGGLVGFVSAILGIGGGVLNVPFLLYHHIDIKKAVGISSAISFAIGLFGFVGYTYSGWNISNLPEYSFGYCNIPIALTLALTAMIFAPIGVKFSHRLPKAKLQITFAILMLIVATQILWKWINLYIK